MSVIKTDIVVVGTGAGGAAVAKELSAGGRKVLVLERGKFAKKIGTLRTAVMEIYDRCALRTSREGIIVYRGLMVGGTTVVSCGNGIRVLEKELLERGISLGAEFEETEKELKIAPLPERLIGSGSRLIMEAGNRLGLGMEPMPKYIDFDKCNSCGKCVLGCPRGAKWSSGRLIEKARRAGADLLTGTNVKSVVIHKGKAIGVVAERENKTFKIYANKVIISAGGIGTPVILRRSGLRESGNRLFVDVFNVTYGIVRDRDINLWKEPTMAVVSKKYYQDRGFILSPFIDVPLVLRWVMSKRKQLKGFRYENLVGIMAKTRDDSYGKVTEDEKFEKVLTPQDRLRLDEGARFSRDILLEAGIREKDIIFTKPRGAHPGGSAAIGDVVNTDLETKVRDLYVCDASVLPVSPGAPPIVTIIALAKRLSRHILSD